MAENGRMNMSQAAEYLGHSYFWLSVSKDRLSIPYSRVGRFPIFMKSELDGWIESQRPSTSKSKSLASAKDSSHIKL